ncbi:MAG: hypothetical protein RL172_1353 [Bacteroidota bacterium]|jgi:transmembrane sensor
MELPNTEHVWALMAKKLAGEATAEELAELELLIRQNPQLNFSKEILLDFWQSAPVNDSQYAENKYRELVQQIKNMGADDGRFTADDHFININGEEGLRQKKGWRWLTVAGSTLVAALVVIILYNMSFSASEPKETGGISMRNEVSTKAGSKTNLLLPDGTKVWLNASSKLTYDKSYGNKLREVTLVGEAYFDVVKNARQPFVIHTSKMDIKVLGTAFNVKCYPGEKTTETSLVRGSIEVTVKDREEKITLKPNEKLVINNEELDEIKESAQNSTAGSKKRTTEKPIISLSHLTRLPKDSSVVIETAWVENRLIFSSETFEEVALKMERWYNVKILLTDELLKKEPLTGNFEKENIYQALEALQLTNTPFSYNLKDNTIIIKKK